MRRRKSKNSIAGFTLIELLVVILLIAVLFAIASPSWIAFVNNQRVGAARGQVFEVLRSAQAEAKRTKLSREVCFDNNGNDPRVATVQYTTNTVTCANRTINTWQSIGNLKPGTIRLSAAPATSRVIFDTDGNLIPTSAAVGYTITIRPGAAPNPRRCVTIRTLLGAMIDGSGDDCPV
ncbi:prepilin-type N-terminal cleavage/methylation domain-containing protein [Phormidesmis sp. 146-35]